MVLFGYLSACLLQMVLAGARRDAQAVAVSCPPRCPWHRRQRSGRKAEKQEERSGAERPAGGSAAGTHPRGSEILKLTLKGETDRQPRLDA